MKGFQWLILCALLYSISVDAFGTCSDDSDDSSCPDFAECDGSECFCKEGFDEIDLPGITQNSEAVTVCLDLGVCSPLDNEVEDCGKNGQCVIIQDKYGVYKALCKCKPGYYGKKCDQVYMSTTPKPSTAKTTKKGSPWVLLGGGGAILLAILVAGAAAAASSFS